MRREFYTSFMVRTEEKSSGDLIKNGTACDPFFSERPAGEEARTDGVTRRQRLDELEPLFNKPRGNDAYGDKNIASVGEDCFVAYSRPAWYRYGSENYQIVDLVVRGDPGESEEQVTKRFEYQKKVAEEYRARAKEFVEKQVILELAEKLEGVNCIIGRGDIYDHNRVPAINDEGADIDLMVFADFSDEESTKEMMNALEGYALSHPGIVVAVNPLEVSSKGYKSEQNVFSAHASENSIVLSVDVVPIDSILELAKNSPDKTFARSMSPYAQRIFTGGSEVLWPPSLKEDAPADYTGEIPKFLRLKHIVNQRLSGQNVSDKITTLG
jgi:hypothetical protein